MSPSAAEDCDLSQTKARRAKPLKLNGHFLALGSAQFGFRYGIANTHGKPSDREVEGILDVARESGIDFLDTAIAYGDSEERLGRIGIDGFRVVTKLPLIERENDQLILERIFEQVAGSLNRLKLDALYAVLIHSPGELEHDRAEAMRSGLSELVKQGLATKAGLSVYRPKEAIDNFEFLPSGIIQAPINVLDRRFLDPGFLQVLAEAKCEITARSAFLQGLLLAEESQLDRRFARWLPLLHQFSEWCKSHALSPLTGCLAIFRLHPVISHLVVGVETSRQLREIVKAWNLAQGAPCFAGSTDDEELLLPMNWSRATAH